MSISASSTATERTPEPVKRYSQPHGLLADPTVAECSRDGEELEVERELLDEQKRQHLLGDLAAEELEANLRVANVEPEEQAHELLVQPAADASRPRIVNVRLRVPLRPDHEVELLVLREPQESRDRRRVEIEVGVDVRDEPPTRRERACLYRISLAEVPVVVDDLRPGWSRRAPPRSLAQPSETTISSIGSPSLDSIRSRMV